MTEERIKELLARSKDDHLSKMIVGSEIRELIAEIRRLQTENEAISERAMALHEERR